MAASVQSIVATFLLALFLPICPALKSGDGGELGLDSNTQVMPADAGSAAVMMLDTDMNGKVDRAEVQAFASKQGLSAEDVASEFGKLDTDGDGELSVDEIVSTMATPSLAPAAIAAPVAPVARGSDVAPLGNDTLAYVAEKKAEQRQDVLLEKGDAMPVTVIADKARTASSYIDAAGESAKPTIDEPQVEKKVITAPFVVVEQESLFQKASIEANAQMEASRALAETFASSASKAFEKQNENEKRAVKLETRAKSLRGRSAAIAKTAEAETAAAAEHAAKAVVEEAEPRVLALQREATRLEREASERRAQAERAMMNVSRAQTEMTEILNHA